MRSTILWTLLDGKALTATELAMAGNTSAQNISMHLAKLVQADLLSVEKQGRHKYYRFSRKEVAYAIEAMANLIPQAAVKNNVVKEPGLPIKYCRSCYDHLAGKMGVSITDSLLQQKIIISHNHTFDISQKGQKWFFGLGINIDELKQQRRLFLKPCLDWSERRHHIAGSLAAALFNKMLSDDWVRRIKHSRAILITGNGEKNLYKYFKISASP